MGCIFLYDTCCTIQEKKPLICQLYPVCISDTSLMDQSEPFQLKDGTDVYIYVDNSCRGVGQGDILDLEEILEKAFIIRTQMFATDLGILVGWYSEYEENY